MNGKNAKLMRKVAAARNLDENELKRNWKKMPKTIKSDLKKVLLRMIDDPKLNIGG